MYIMKYTNYLFCCIGTGEATPSSQDYTMVTYVWNFFQTFYNFVTLVLVSAKIFLIMMKTFLGDRHFCILVAYILTVT